MPDFSFSSDEVEDVAGKKPWTRQRDFSAEIRPGEMADTALVYARAAGEADGAGELARHATEVAADAGTLDGAPLVDEDGRIDATARGLQGNGQDMDRVVGYVVRAMNEAITAEEEVTNLILGDGGLEEARSRHISAAVNEWEGWQGALRTAVESPLPPSLTRGRIDTVQVTYRGTTLDVPPTHRSALETVYQLPDSLAAGIRRRHLDDCADSARATDADITDAVTAYRGRLADYGAELGDLGYDLSDGPLGLFTSEDQAVWAADRLAEELREEPPDHEALRRWTETLESIRLGVHGDPPGSTRPLTDAELAYLDAFYGRLDADALVALGRLAGEGEDADPPTGGHAAAQRVANGLTMMLDWRVGGHDPEREPGAIPEALRPFVLDHEDSILFDPSLPVGFDDELRRFNDFGDLMGTATVPPGDEFGRVLAEAAVDLGQRTNVQYLLGVVDGVPNTVSSDLLHVASLNTGLSADLLNDDTFRSGLLGITWQDSEGAADLITSGTTIPPGLDHHDNAAGAYVEAAYHLFTDAPDRSAEILGTANDHPADHTALQTSLSDLAVRYMDQLSKPESPESAFAAGASPGDVTDPDLLGNDYRYSFDLSHDDRMKLFTLLGGTEKDVNEQFNAGVAAWQETTAYNAFVRDGTSGRGQDDAFAAIGRVEGTLHRAELDRDIPTAASARNQSSLVAGIAAAGTIIKDATPPLPGKIGVVVATYGLGTGIRYLMPDTSPSLDWQAENEAFRNGDTIPRRLIAEAAVHADHRGLGDATLTDPTDDNLNETDMLRSVERIEHEYDSYRDAMRDAYRGEVYSRRTP
ncbi:hypothetical protein [Streptomyces avicenniae]|uniref:TPR repeat region-containing protein n=1 Tax=Streptomyces avicenniae TaxID=500153 RepID=UPI00167E343B|nr:hypothetical protein [Streptomyces avicenniae]